MPSQQAEARSSQAEFVDMWRRQMPWWHGGFAVAWLICLVPLLLATPPRPAFGWQLLCLGGLAALYAALGLTERAFSSHRWAWVYVVLAWSLMFVVFALDPEPTIWVLAFVLYPQMWAMLERRSSAAAASLVVVLAMGVLQWGHSSDPAALPGLVIGSLISLGLSLGVGFLITSMVGEASRRAVTIDELRATQSRLAAVERDQGVALERERLSREIHDTLAQGFLSVLSLTRAADAALLRGDLDRAREHLGLVEQTAADNLSEARLMVAELTPGHLQSRTLAEALGRLVDTVCRESPLRASLTVAGEPQPLGGALEVTLLRTAQEALANVRRHAEATEVTMTLTYTDPGFVVLEVVDDGRGFDPDAVASGFGLDGIRARTAQLGGSVDVLSRLGRGTSLRMVVPR